MIHVLIVEDDPMVAELYRRYISMINGFSLSASAASVSEAKKILESNTIDLVLLDNYMPGDNGLELLAHFRRSDHSIDCIMISAARDSQTVQTALRLGVVDYLVKPFDFERFQSALQNYGQRNRAMRKDEPLSQANIDRDILAKPQSFTTAGLPKGIERETLERITAAAKIADDEFSTEHLAQTVGISRVSLRKYLEYMKSIDLLHSRLVHRSIGRPVSLYTYVGSK